MAELLLVHGSGFGGWAFEALIPALARLGIAARAIDLPGRGGEATSLADQADAIGQAIRGDCVLLGHSSGGYPVTAAARFTGARGIVYLAAYVPQPGQSLAGQRRAGPSQPMRGIFRLSADRQSYRFAPAAAERLFFHDCPDPAALAARMGPEPVLPQETPFDPLPDLPRAAIIAAKDRAIPPEWQRKMAKGIPCHEFASGHCPHIARPERLATLLATILGRMENATPPVAP